MKQTANTLILNGADWRVSGWMRHQWKFQKLMETDSFSLPAVLAVDAIVPGAVQVDLLRAGVIEDWNVGDNFLHMEWVEHREWVYEKHFCLENKDAQRYELCFEGLDFSGYIHLNGSEVYHFEGMHLPHRVDVTEQIKAGDNHLKVIFLQPPEVEGQVGYTSRVKTLKSRYNYGWDWMPRMVNIGVFGDVYLKMERGAVLGDVYPRVTVDGSDGVLSLAAEIKRVDDRSLTLVCELSDAVGQGVGRVQLAIEGESVEAQLRVSNVKTWNVAGFGEQNLYTLRTCICDGESVLDEKIQRIGFRTLTYTRPSGAAEDSVPYVPVVNGTTIPIRGINWVPLSPFYGAVSEADYRKQLMAIRDMNVTLIRVWGGALLESETFYDICDELGLLVWQEFPQSSSGIENAACADPDFIEDVVRVAKVDILRRRARACLAFWCGGNELYYDDYRPQGLEHPTLLALHDAVKDLDPARLFLPASPSGPVPGSMDYIGTGKLHDTHGPWNYAAGPYAYYTESNRNDSLLHSEVGAPAASRMELLERYAGDAKLWPPTKENRFWLTRGAWWLHMEQMQSWFGEFDGETRDLATYVKAFRFVQAEALRYVSGAVRHAGDKKAGIIIWMGNEPFPNAANTSLLEFDGCPKPAYYEMKRAFAPAMLGLRHDSVVAKDGKVTVVPFLRADKRVLSQCCDDLMLRAYDLSGTLVAEHCLPVTNVEGDFAVVDIPVTVPVLARLESKTLGICVEYVFLPAGEHPFSPLVDRAAADVEVTVENGCITLLNRGASVALYCDVTAYDSKGQTVCAADGNLCLLPGERRCYAAPGAVRAAVCAL